MKTRFENECRNTLKTIKINVNDKEKSDKDIGFLANFMLQKKKKLHKKMCFYFYKNVQK